MRLQLDNIRKEFDGKVAVNNLSLVVPQGVIFGIIGPNGAGKTTTIRMIMNITMPDSGRILWDDKPVGPEFRNQVGYLPEERGLYKKLTLAEVILYMGELKGAAASDIKANTDPWLERMNLREYKNHKVEELSKGMQQKLQFVTTVIHDPQIVIFDELFSGLDPINIELIKNIILDLKRAKKTILFSTHVMEQAEKLCDHVCMISQGEKVLDGRLSDIKAQFGKNTLQFAFEGDGGFVRRLTGVREITEFNNYIEVDLEDGTDPSEILRAVSEKVRVTRFELVEPSLYDIFIEKASVDPSTVKRGEEVTNA